MSPPTVPSRPGGDRPIFTIVLLLGGASALTPLGFDTTVAAFRAMQIGLGTDASAIRLTMTAYFVGSAFGSLVHGPFADRFGRKPVMLFGFALFGLSAVGCALAHAADLLALFRLVAGLAAASGQVIMRAMVRDLFDRETSARVISYVLIVHGSVQITAPVVGAYLTSFFGWRAIFVFLAGYGFVMVPFALRLMRETLSAERRRPLRLATTLTAFAVILRSRVYRIHLAILASISAGAIIFLINGPAVLTGHFGLSAETFGYLFSSLIGSMLIARFAVARLIGRFTLEQITFVGCLLAAGGGLALGGLGFAGIDHWAAVVAPIFLVVIGVSVVTPQTIASAMQPFRDLAGAASSLLGFLQLISGSAIAYLVGFFDRGDQLHMTTGVAVFPAIGLFVYLRYVHRRGGAEG